MRLPVLFTSVIGCCGAHATKDLQCFLPFFVSYSLHSSQCSFAFRKIRVYGNAMQRSILILKFIFW